MDEEPDVKDVIRAIATGTRIDWPAVESPDADESSRIAVRNLRIISRIADFNRDLQKTVDSPSGAGDSSEPSIQPTWGPLAVLEHIGRGSFGDVYRAWDSRLEREVALKLIRQSTPSGASSRAVQEGRLLARVRHPNIVTVHGADIIDGQIGIWMEFLRGRTLEAIVRDRGRLDVEEAGAAGVAVCRALGAVHRAGLLHRDVKAQNVMREEDGRIVLMDFGAGQEMAAANGGDLAGTPLYVAPEVLLGELASPRSEVYSVGVLLFFLTTRVYPVQGKSLSELREVHRRGDRRRLADLRPDLPAAFVTVVDQAIAVSSSGRFENAEAFERALVAALEPSEQAGDASTAYAPRVPSKTWLALAAVLAILVVGGVLASRGSAFSNRGIGSSASGRGGTSLAIAAGPTVRDAEVANFYATGEPSRTGRWLPGYDMTGELNLAVVDLFAGTRQLLTHQPDGAGASTDAAAISPDEQLVAYSWHPRATDPATELRLIGVDGVGERVLYSNPTGDVAPVGWAPFGRRLLVMRTLEAGVELAWIDADTRAVSSLVPLRGLPRKVSLSPDGGLVAYDLPSDSNASERDIYVYNAVSGRTTPLLVDPANDLAPLWLPSGGGLAFSSDRNGHLGLWMVPVTRAGDAAGAPQLVRDDMGRFQPIGFGQDASFFYHVITGTADVYAARIDVRAGAPSAPEVMSTRFVGTNLFSDWSPDGRSLVFTSRRGEVDFEPRSHRLVIRDTTSGIERTFAPNLSGLTFPRWSPDGQSIAVVGVDKGIYRVAVADGSVDALLLSDRVISYPWWTPNARELFFVASGPPPHIQALNVQTGKERTVIERANLLALSHDGRDLAFGRVEGENQAIYSVLNGTTPHLILNVPRGGVELIAWTRDGSELLVSRRSKGPKPKPTEILAVPARGGAPRTIATLVLDDPRSFRLSPDGTHLSFEAGYPAQSMRVIETFIKR